MKFMRIVAYGGSNVFVQTSDNKERDYTQTIMNVVEFEKFMQEQFPKQWEEFLDYNRNADWQLKKTSSEFFYHYNETEEMRRKGIAYIYTK